jgi:hypothetical protein
MSQGSIPSQTLSSIASQSHVTSSLAGTSLPSWIWVHVPVLIDVSYSHSHANVPRVGLSMLTLTFT